MNPVKATHYYHRRPDLHAYVKDTEIDRGPMERDFASESYSHTDRLAESIRLKLLKVLTLTLLRELEGVGIEPTREADEFNLQDEVEHFEAELIRSALIMTGGRQRRAARLLGMKVTTLHSKIRRYGLNPEAISQQSEQAFADGGPTAAEAVRTSLELVEAIFETNHKDPASESPEIHVTGAN